MATATIPQDNGASTGARVAMPSASVAASDSVSDPRRMRRIIAEDPEWNVSNVPSLVQMSLRVLADNFENEPCLDKVPDKFKLKLLSGLDVGLPLSLTANMIEDEQYWRRCCEARWENCAVKQSGGSWRRYFFEQNLTEILEHFVPGTTNPTHLLDTLKLTGKYIIRLNLRQLMPRRDSEPELSDPPSALAEDDQEGEAASPEEPTELSDAQHIDFRPILPHLTNMESLSMQYTVKDCGMDFKWSMFGMTRQDALGLFDCLQDFFKDGCSLTSLSLQKSHIDDRKARVLASHLLGNKQLKSLNLAHNQIGDRGARALAKLLHGNCVLQHLDVSDNKIRNVGARALGMALRDNRWLNTLTIRMNRLEDAGGRAFFDGLTGNSCLEALNVSGNGLGISTAKTLRTFLSKNKALQHLDVTCNELGESGGKELLLGMETNGTLRSMDMRLCKFDKQTELLLNELLHNNLRIED